MANEGSTKPTYSELVGKAAKWLEERRKEGLYGFRAGREVWHWKYPEICAAFAESELKAAEAENLRVRGLLQLMAGNMKAYGHHLPKCMTQQKPRPGIDVDHCDCGFRDAWRWAKSVADSKVGAESADIGKLDTADEMTKRCDYVSKFIPNRICTLDGGHTGAHHCVTADCGGNCGEKSCQTCNPASAETGGEKA